jgi:3-oxoacyl-[acyl-carrier protein] reductase
VSTGTKPATRKLAGRRAVVTGASSGIGKAIALELAAAGASVIVHYRASKRSAEMTSEECTRLGGPSSVVPCDLAQENLLADVVDRLWADGPIDIWINNAGVDLLTGDSRLWSYSQKLQSLFEVDLRATMLLSKRVGSLMKSRGTGVILNVGWDQAERGMEGDSGELFAAIKGAVMCFTRSLACSLAPEVRVNCLAPGWIRTAWGEQASPVWQERVLRETPLQRWGEPEDLAKLARFLVSEDASYLTGQIYNANGGAVR